jgi:hypothetical protein
MTREHGLHLGIESRKEADKHWARMLFFGALLLVSHLLTIKPSGFAAEGIQIAIEDVSVVHGGIALVFFYYTFMSLSLFLQGVFLMPFSMEKSMARWLLKVKSRPKLDEKLKKRRRPTPQEAKRAVRWGFFWYHLVMTPFYLAVTGIMMTGIPLATYDVYDFAAYSWEKLTIEPD